jgi:sugar phosphate isomerase/epimerase
LTAVRCALQLYSVRGEAARDFRATLEHVGGLGLDGVELAGLHGHPPAAVRGWLDDAGLGVAASFVSLDALEDDPDGCYDAAETLGTPRVVVEWLPPSLEAAVTSGYVRRLARAAEHAGAAGIRLGFHTHDAELRAADDGSVLVERLLTEVPALELELDLGWAWIAGREPGDVLAQAGDRCRAVHVKDFAARDDPASFTAVGEGAVPFLEALRAAGPGRLEWLVAEQDDAFVPDELAAASRSAAALLALRDALGA